MCGGGGGGGGGAEQPLAPSKNLSIKIAISLLVTQGKTSNFHTILLVKIFLAHSHEFLNLV